MKTRFAFAGFRHTHILELLSAVKERADTEVVACCEEDAGTLAELAANGRVTITHTDSAKMLGEAECDVVAIGDYYSRRGALVIAALQAGRHVLSDKPLCTTLEEQTAIEKLAAEKGLLVGLQLDSRGYGAFRAARELIGAGEIGEICAIRIDAQHPLLAATRPAWYFEPGKHGGTINDIGIHAFDFVPWITGLEWKSVVAARSWNQKARFAPHFQDSAQVLAVLQNGAGVMADFSYLAPDRLGYQLPHYWHLLIHGSAGLLETHLLSEEVSVIKDNSSAPEVRPALKRNPHGYLSDFLNEMRGNRDLADLTSAQCLRASRLALETQAAAGK